MKGYSFQELVNLAEAAVKRAGDTMTGNLTVPAVNLSASQSSAPNTATRKDYVDGEIAKRVAKTGDTMTGNLTAPKVLVSGAQGTESNALTRKDYVDAELAKKLNLTGGTLTGNLTAPAVLVSSAQNTSVNALTRKDYVDSAIAAGDALQVSKTGDTMTGNLTTPKVLVSGAQGTEVNALTRKDYVDGQVATRAPTAHTHTVADITDLKPQEIAATANTLVLRDGSADVNARLLRTTYADESAMSGAIAFRVNNSTNNYTRYCSDPASVRDWMKGAKTNWDISWRAYIEHSDNPMTEYHIPGKTAVITYLTPDGNYRITTSSGIGGAITDRLRLDSSGNLFATAAVHEAGQRVYSPNNQPHYSHNHTAAQGNADVVASSYGQIGSYIMAAVISTVTPPATGGTIAGSNLRPSGAGESNYSGTALAGTWKLMGSLLNANTDDRYDDRTSLFIRVA